jgi:hypothetical protein
MAVGWIEDPPDTENKDWLLSRDSKILSLGLDAQNEMDVSHLYRPVSNQANFPTCAANACADAGESQVIIEKMGQGMPLEQAIESTPDLSRMFAMFNGKQLMDPPRGYDPSYGCHNRLILDGMMRHGICTETRWPYIGDNIAKRPSLKAYQEAFAHQYAGFYAIKETGTERAALILKSLAALHGVVFGTSLEQAFKSYKTGIIQRPQSDIIGRHAMVIVGWSMAKQAFKVRNSWSKYWGEQGHCWMSFDYIINFSGSKSFWVLTKGGLA